MIKNKHLTHCTLCKKRVLVEYYDKLDKKFTTLVGRKARFDGNRLICESCIKKEN